MKKSIRFATVFAATLSACAVFCSSALADPFRVRDLVVDKVAPSAAEASQQGRAEARIVGASRLIERLTLPEDRANARTPIDTMAVSRLYRGSETQGEQKSTSVTGGVRATGLVTWNFRADAVRDYLDKAGVPYVDTQAATALIVPVATGGIDPGQWAGQWTTRGAAPGQVIPKSDDTVLTPYVGSVLGWNRRPAVSEIQAELSSTGADHGVIAEIYQQGAQYYVRLVDMRANAPKPDIGVAGPFVSLASAQTGAVAEMERSWKVSSIVRTTGSTSVSLVATFGGLEDWVKIRKSIENSRLISNLNIESITTVGADITFTYAGRPEQLAADLRSRGVDLANGTGGWVLRVAA